jgi:hypothetical protein
LGATLGAIHALSMRQHWFPHHWFPLDSMNWIHASTSCIPSDFVNYMADPFNLDFVMLWRLIRGLGYGIQIGYLWLIILGKSSKSTALSRYIYRHLWRPMKRQYQRSAVQIGQTKKIKNSMVALALENRTRNVDYEGVGNGENNRHHCSICLENFDDLVNFGETNNNLQRDFSLPDRYQMLPCHHSFHRDCARHWLTIQQTCPICRVQVKGMKGCADLGTGVRHDDDDDIIVG